MLYIFPVSIDFLENRYFDFTFIMQFMASEIFKTDNIYIYIYLNSKIEKKVNANKFKVKYQIVITIKGDKYFALNANEFIVWFIV